MTIKPTKDGWKADFRVGGANGKRYRKTCKSKAEAERYQKYVEAQHVTTGKPWLEKPKDRRRLSELVELWYQHLGQHLRYGAGRKSKLDNIVTGMSDPIAAQVTPKIYTEYRASRAAIGLKPATLNGEQKFLSIVYNSLKKLAIIDYDNPIKGLKPIPSVETEMHYLTHEQIHELLPALRNSRQPETELVARICLGTGARWGEAERLSASRVHNKKVTFTETKSGKNRTIPIDNQLYKLLRQRSKDRPTNLFDECASNFRDVLESTSIKLPKGQKTHVLRHTFASHFMINGGNILALQKILGHYDLSMTLRYAHLAPDHLQDAVKFNPLSHHGQNMDKTSRE